MTSGDIFTLLIFFLQLSYRLSRVKEKNSTCIFTAESQIRATITIQTMSRSKPKKVQAPQYWLQQSRFSMACGSTLYTVPKNPELVEVFNTVPTNPEHVEVLNPVPKNPELVEVINTVPKNPELVEVINTVPKNPELVEELNTVPKNPELVEVLKTVPKNPELVEELNTVPKNPELVEVLKTVPKNPDLVEVLNTVQKKEFPPVTRACNGRSRFICKKNTDICTWFCTKRKSDEIKCKKIDYFSIW